MAYLTLEARQLTPIALLVTVRQWIQPTLMVVSSASLLSIEQTT